MVIRDPVHGDVEFTPLERAVIDSPEVQRLRGIKQTGTANLVYPGCVHTRFDHSLGVAAVARRILGQLKSGGHPVDPRLERVVGVAALLHDVAHLPYGHTLEDERRLLPRHDQGDRLRRVLARGRLQEFLTREGLFDDVLGVLGRDGRRAEPWASEVISSTIDADLLDYLRRDSYFAGLSLNYDDRIYRYFTVAGGHLCINMVKDGADRPDARSEVLQLLRMRYFLTERVFYHHAKVASGAMVAKAVELAMADGLTEERLLELRDDTLLDTLARWPAPSLVENPVRDLAHRVLGRRLYKRGYVLSARTLGKKERLEFVERLHRSPQGRREAEAALAGTLGCPPSEVIIWCPDLFLMKEAEALVRTSAGVTRLNAPRESPPLDVRALEDQYEALWRMVVLVPEERQAACQAEAEAYFGYPSEHRPAGTEDAPPATGDGGPILPAGGGPPTGSRLPARGRPPAGGPA